MEPIASLQMVRLSPSGERVPVRVDIGKPLYDERGSWACPIVLTSIDGKIREIHGEDSMQALCLGVRFIHSMLQSELNRGQRLLQTGEGTEDVDFPLDAYFGIGEPGAPPNGGPAKPFGTSGVTEGPPSVS